MAGATAVHAERALAGLASTAFGCAGPRPRPRRLGGAAGAWVWVLATVLCSVHAEPSRFMGFDKYGHVRESDAPAHTPVVTEPRDGAAVTATGKARPSAWPGT